MRNIFLLLFVLFTTLHFSIFAQNPKVDNLIKLAAITEDAEEKIKFISNAIEIENKNSNLYKIRGDYYLISERSQDAVEDYDNAIAFNSKFTDAYIQRGIAKYNLGYYDEAISDYSEAIKLDPKSATSYRNRAHSKKQLGYIEGSILDYDLAIQIAIENSNKIVLKEAYSGRGNSYYYLSEYSKAKNDFKNALAIDSLQGYCYLKLGIINFIEKDFQSSLEFLKSKAVPLLSKNKKYDLLCESYIYISKNNRELRINDTISLKTAKVNADLALRKIKTNNTYAYYMRGRSYYENGEFEKALLDFNKAIGTRGKDTRYLINRANAYYKLASINIKDPETSKDYFNRALTDYELAFKTSPKLKFEEQYYEQVKSKIEINIFSSNAISEAKYYAILIGIDNYSNSWSSLKNPVNDCRTLSKILKEKYNFQEIDTLYNSQASRVNIIQILEQASKKTSQNPNLNVLIYYAGHGELKKEINKGFWIPQDAKTNSSSGYISNTDIRDYLKSISIHSKHTLLIADSCFSGDLTRNNSNTNETKNFNDKYFNITYERKSVQVLTSGGIEPVSDIGSVLGHSVFAGYLIKALKNNNNLFVDVSQIFDEIKVPIANNSDQSPILKPIQEANDEGGQFIFVNKSKIY